MNSKGPSSGNPFECHRSLIYSIRTDMTDMSVLCTNGFVWPFRFYGLLLVSRARFEWLSFFYIVGSFHNSVSLLNCRVENNANSSKPSGSKVSGFRPASFPGESRSSDFVIHGSSLGMPSPICDKTYSVLLVWNLWIKSENNLRFLSYALRETARNLLKDKEKAFSDLKSKLLHIDNSVGMCYLFQISYEQFNQIKAIFNDS